MLRHSVSYNDNSIPHFSPNSGGIACRVAELNAALCLDTRAKKSHFVTQHRDSNINIGKVILPTSPHKKSINKYDLDAFVYEYKIFYFLYKSRGM